jgi:hypothetical protein
MRARSSTLQRDNVEERRDYATLQSRIAARCADISTLDVDNVEMSTYNATLHGDDVEEWWQDVEHTTHNVEE